MSESVVVNFVANALWQLHRFLQLCLRHMGSWLNYSSLTVPNQPSQVI